MTSPMDVEAPAPPSRGAPAVADRALGLQWPDAACWRTTAIYGAAIFLLWLLVYGGANWVTGLHGRRVALQTSLDAAVPFVPAAAVIYLTVYVMPWIAPFVLHTPARLRELARALALAILLAGIGYLLVPAELIDTGPTNAETVGRLYQLADWINLTHNYFPSLHVGIAVVCAVTFSRYSTRSAGTIYWLWAALIAISTMLTEQHYVLDVVVGAMLGVFAAQCARGWGLGAGD
jgi:membrane-associated phospholipid phosphatase